MNARIPSAEASAEHLIALIAARTGRIEDDIFVGRASTVRAVAEKCAFSCDEDEALALVRAAVIGRSAVVGTRIAGIVQHAIYAYALPLAKGDLADAERSSAESADDDRIAYAQMDRELA